MPRVASNGRDSGRYKSCNLWDGNPYSCTLGGRCLFVRDHVPHKISPGHPSYTDAAYTSRDRVKSWLGSSLAAEGLQDAQTFSCQLCNFSTCSEATMETHYFTEEHWERYEAEAKRTGNGWSFEFNPQSGRSATFVCLTCNKCFPSYQLRACHFTFQSHKRNVELAEADSKNSARSVPPTVSTFRQEDRPPSSPLHPPSPSHSEALPSHLRSLRVRTVDQGHSTGEEMDDGSGSQGFRVEDDPRWGAEASSWEEVLQKAPTEPHRPIAAAPQLPLMREAPPDAASLSSSQAEIERGPAVKEAIAVKAEWNREAAVAYGRAGDEERRSFADSAAADGRTVKPRVEDSGSEWRSNSKSKAEVPEAGHGARGGWGSLDRVCEERHGRSEVLRPLEAYGRGANHGEAGERYSEGRDCPPAGRNGDISNNKASFGEETEDELLKPQARPAWEAMLPEDAAKGRTSFGEETEEDSLRPRAKAPRGAMWPEDSAGIAYKARGEGGSREREGMQQAESEDGFWPRGGGRSASPPRRSESQHQVGAASSRRVAGEQRTGAPQRSRQPLPVPIPLPRPASPRPRSPQSSRDASPVQNNARSEIKGGVGVSRAPDWTDSCGDDSAHRTRQEEHVRNPVRAGMATTPEGMDLLRNSFGEGGPRLYRPHPSDKWGSRKSRPPPHRGGLPEWDSRGGESPNGSPQGSAARTPQGRGHNVRLRDSDERSGFHKRQGRGYEYAYDDEEISYQAAHPPNGPPSSHGHDPYSGPKRPVYSADTLRPQRFSDSHLGRSDLHSGTESGQPPWARGRSRGAENGGGYGGHSKAQEGQGWGSRRDASNDFGPEHGYHPEAKATEFAGSDVPFPDSFGYGVVPEVLDEIEAMVKGGFCGAKDINKKAMKHLSSMAPDMALKALRRFAASGKLHDVHDRSAYLQGIIRNLYRDLGERGAATAGGEDRSWKDSPEQSTMHPRGRTLGAEHGSGERTWNYRREEQQPQGSSSWQQHSDHGRGLGHGSVACSESALAFYPPGHVSKSAKRSAAMKQANAARGLPISKCAKQAYARMKASGIDRPMLMTSQPEEVVGWGHLDDDVRRS